VTIVFGFPVAEKEFRAIETIKKDLLGIILRDVLYRAGLERGGMMCKR